LKTKPESDIAQTLGIERSLQRARRLKRLFAIAVLIIAATAAAIAWRRSNKIANAPKYQTQAAQRGDLIVTVTATGNLEPTNQVEVGSELSGIVETVEVDYNDRVKVGQVLAKLDTDKLRAQVIKSQAALESARARVLQAQANVLETRNELDRLKQVWEKTGKKAPSQHDLDAGEAAFKRAQAEEAGANAQVSEAQATLDSNQTDLAKALIRSPIDGIVLTREVEPGQTVAASLQAPILFTLAEDLAHMELHVDVDEADVGQVKKGQNAVFTVDAYPDMRFQAIVSQVRFGSQTVGGVVTYETLLNVDNSSLLLRPGMTATADMIVREIGDAVLVPNSALRFSPPVHKKQPSEGGSITSRLFARPYRRPSPRPTTSAGTNSQKRVWTLRNGSPVAIPITIGSTDGRMTEVVAGEVEPGMELLVGIEEASQ
jgi:HlyD family secretion protein